MPNFDIEKCQTKKIDLSKLNIASNLVRLGCIYVTYTRTDVDKNTICVTNSIDWINELLDDDRINQCPIYTLICERAENIELRDKQKTSLLSVWDLVRHETETEIEVQKLRSSRGIGHGFGFAIKHRSGVRETYFLGGKTGDVEFFLRMSKEKELMDSLLMQLRQFHKS